MIRSDFIQILEAAIQADASDVHLVAYHPPIFRIHGELIPDHSDPLEPLEMQRLLYSILTDKQKATFEETWEVEFSYFVSKDFHYRVNIHREKGHAAATVRIMPTQIRTTLELGLPPSVVQLARKRNGLIMVTGTAGSGKTTSLTAMVNIINNERKCKIITIEDPIEYVYKSNKSLIIQREVGSDTLSFTNALKFALRQDPDVVVIGEIRDLESISMALTTAETGHLVLTTLHAASAVESINRIIDVYPAGKQEQIRVQLADCLLAVIGQNLLPRREMLGRVLTCEILVGTLSVRNMIRRGALSEIRGHMEAGADEGMQTLEQSLSALVHEGLVTKETALKYARHSKLLQC